jgi:hypothetical protein
MRSLRRNPERTDVHQKVIFMTRMLKVAVLLAILAASVATATSAAAQDTACPLPPVTLPLFDATPAAEVPGANATPASPDDPARAATEEEITQFTAAVEVIVACINTGSGPLVNAVFTDRYLASRFADPTRLYQPDFERMIEQTAATALPAEPLVIDNIENVQVREDGRLSGRVVLSSGGQTWRDTLVLAQVGDYWLIDDVILESR